MSENAVGSATKDRAICAVIFCVAAVAWFHTLTNRWTAVTRAQSPSWVMGSLYSLRRMRGRTFMRSSRLLGYWPELAL